MLFQKGGYRRVFQFLNLPSQLLGDKNVNPFFLFLLKATLEGNFILSFISEMKKFL